ncbi:hypothetical protein [Deinococcus humi]|uniref:Uncharacterized protein n=1 Tax=Deinococcus humi TaxID=662880 RepID=A0A7W8NH14_9DEIO|nr:hypothetical protein [Deinococcus humi]MBB5364348.1 hypothetical protein [Deinococcus humi]
MTKSSSWTALALTLSLGHGQALSPQVTSTPATAQRAVTPSKPPAPSNVTRNSAAPAVPGNAPVVKTGLQTIFTTNQLTGNSAVKMIASTNYQIVLVFPSRVQSIGINTSKQDAVLASIDRYDGRVVYIDALQAGGTATINFRLLTAAEQKAEKSASGEIAANPNSSPVILKVLMDLTDKGSGVLSYTIKNPAPRPAPATAAKPPVQAVKPPTPVVKPAVPTAKPPAPTVKPPALVVKPPPVPARPVSAPAPARPTSFAGTNGALTLTVDLEGNARTPNSQALRYTVGLNGAAAGKTYTLDTAQTSLRVKNVPVSDLSILKGYFPVGAAAPFKGTVEVPQRVLEQAGPKVLMFVVIEADATTRATARKYVGVILK